MTITVEDEAEMKIREEACYRKMEEDGLKPDPDIEVESEEEEEE